MELDLDQEQDYLTDLGKAVAIMRNNLDKGKKVLAQKVELTKEVVKYERLMSDLTIVVDSFNTMYNDTVKEDVAYKNKRLDMISSHVDYSLAKLFPDDGFRTKMTVDTGRRMKAKLVLYDKYGIERNIEIVAGGMMQSTMGIASARATCKALNTNKFYMDEGYAAASDTSLPKCEELTKEMLEEGAQIFMVEHKTAGYENLPRKEFHLVRDTLSNIASIAREEIFE